MTIAEERVRKKRTITRDFTLFVVGLGLIVREAIFENSERPYMLMLFATMIGLPLAFRADSARSKKEE